LDTTQEATDAPLARDDRGAPAKRFGVRPADPAAFSVHRIGAIRHDFHEHPLMQLDALATLAKDLFPKGQCRFIKPGSTQASAFDHAARDPDGRDIAEVFDRIEEPGSWVALYNVEKHPAYRPFLEEVLSTVAPLVAREQGAIIDVGGFIFISAPPSVTPFHIDRENNFWLQVRGRKQMNVWDPTDRVAVPAADIDTFIVYGALDNVRMKDGTLERSHVFDVAPGEGVYFPSTSAHATRTEASWVRPGDGVSISIGVVFYTEHTRRMANIHALNLFLRGLGFTPKEPGASAWGDAIKLPLGRLLVGAKKALRGFKPRPGF
jgi:hypothetical protein